MEAIKKEVKGILRDLVESVQVIRAESAKAREKIDSGDYSQEFIDRELRPLIDRNRQRVRDMNNAGYNAVNKALSRFLAQSWQENRLHGEALTADAQLLNLGVKLPVEELEGIYDRSAGNTTMQRLVMLYARDKGIELNRPAVANLAHDKRMANEIGNAADLFLANWASSERAGEMLDKFFPEDDAPGAEG